MPAPRDAHPDLHRVLTFFPTDNPQPQHLTRAQVDHFNAKGYVGPLDVFSADEIAAHRAYFDGMLQEVLDAGQSAYTINGWHLHRRGLYDLVCEPRISDYVSDLLGQTLICWGTHYFCKMPGDTKRVAWHQDASYWPLTPSKTVTVWLAIDDVDLENGAMKVIPGSHLHGQINFDDSKPEEQNVLGQTVNDALSYGETPVPQCMKAGQISLHSDLLLHGSEPNPSSRRRCGLTMRFVPPDVVPHKGWGRHAALTRGTLPAGSHWTPMQRPAGEATPQYIADAQQKRREAAPAATT